MPPESHLLKGTIETAIACWSTEPLKTHQDTGPPPGAGLAGRPAAGPSSVNPLSAPLLPGGVGGEGYTSCVLYKLVR